MTSLKLGYGLNFCFLKSVYDIPGYIHRSEYNLSDKVRVSGIEEELPLKFHSAVN